LQNAIQQSDDEGMRENAVQLVRALSDDASVRNLRSSIDLKVDQSRFHSVVRQLLVRMDLIEKRSPPHQDGKHGESTDNTVGPKISLEDSTISMAVSHSSIQSSTFSSSVPSRMRPDASMSYQTLRPSKGYAGGGLLTRPVLNFGDSTPRKPRAAPRKDPPSGYSAWDTSTPHTPSSPIQAVFTPRRSTHQVDLRVTATSSQSQSIAGGTTPRGARGRPVSAKV